jgi:hypothetical protein
VPLAQLRRVDRPANSAASSLPLAAGATRAEYK